MSDTTKVLQRELEQARENLELIHERMSQYVLSTDIPLQLAKEKRQIEKRISQLERRIHDLRPIEVLRRATKLLVGPVAQALTGEQWKKWKQRLLTQASKLPVSKHLDVAVMESAADDLVRLIHDMRVLLAAYRIEPNPGQMEALERRAGALAAHLIQIYRLESGDVPELEALAKGLQSER
jgi:hypothetical protein